MLSWFDIGASMYVSVNSAVFERSNAFPVGENISVAIRTGHVPNINAQRGKVIRAINVSGRAENLQSSIGNLAVFVAPGATKIDYGAQVALSPNNQSWAVSVPDTTVPIGLLRQGAGQPDSNQWAGVSTSGLAVLGMSRADGRLPLVQRQLGVSSLPLWTITAPAALVVGQTDGVIRLRVFYSDGEAVVGLRVWFNTATTDVELAFASGLAHSGTATTDATGSIALPINVLRSGATAVQFLVSDARCELDYFSPPLSGVLPLNNASAAPAGPGCVSIPPQAAVPAVPASTSIARVFAWDAGANSVSILPDDVEMVCSLDAVVGVVVGFTADRTDVQDFNRLSHAFYFHYAANGSNVVSIMENGRITAPAVLYTLQSQMKIRRVGSRVSYYTGNTLWQHSFQESVGNLSVGSALFADGDAI